MITLVILDENGKHVTQAVTIPYIFPGRDDTHFACLRFIDPYGDTVFNGLQCESLLEELELLRGLAIANGHEVAINQIESLAQQCKNEPHLYLKFIGD